MKRLVIVESPSKSKTIKQYLGNDYEVLSSKGHIRDLSISNVGGLGLDIENNFTPKYDIIKDKEKTVRDLNKAAKKVDEIYLATDPDREGEAISWHLQEVLTTKDKPIKRVIFNEVTKSAVTEAFQQPRDIDLALVSSQETRRILDRIIGFKLSKLLQNKIKSKSAGRVQSAALKILVEREKEIDAFTPEEYWRVKAIFEQFEAELARVDKRKAKLTNEAETTKLIATLGKTFTIDQVRSRERKRAAKPPFTTSSLQQEASNKLNFTAQKTMLIAQRLYEGIELASETVGLITYMRTDSNRLSDTFVYPAKSYIEETYGKEYVGTKSRHKHKKNIQDAHEAIRPTAIKYHPDKIKTYLSRDELRLYTLIYQRAVASLMRSARINTTTIFLNNANTVFKARAQELTFDGYLKVYGKYESLELKQLPELKEGNTLEAKSFNPSQHFTQPPARFTEATLIKEMEELGIGRPSTYSQTISTLKNRKYVTIEEKKFMPTDQGKLTIEKLDGFFSQIINVDYTAKMENILDDIAQNKEEQTVIISNFYHTFIPLVDKANREMEKTAPKTTGETCPKCGKEMVYRESRYGTFEACSGYPDCKYIKPNGDKPEPPKSTNLKCPKCQKGTIVERVAKRGKSKGNSFYACDNFPKCKHILSGKPTHEHCPKCNNLMVETEDGTIRCDDQKTCGFVQKP